MPKIVERRSNGSLKMRSPTGDEVMFDGYASTTEPAGSRQGYEVHDQLGAYTERIQRGAFTKTLLEDTGVPLLLNHDTNLLLANTRSKTMSLNEDDHGLHVVATLDPRSTVANDLIVAMSRGDLSQMSFSFRAIKDTWNDSYDERTVTEPALFDVAPVVYPANPGTSAALRFAEYGHSEDNPAALVRAYRIAADLGAMQRAGKRLSADSLARLEAAQDAISDAAKHLKKLKKGKPIPPLAGGQSGLDGDAGGPGGAGNNGPSGSGDAPADALGPRSEARDALRRALELGDLAMNVRAKYAAKQLKQLKAAGKTFPGTTSYPIADKEDLDKAIHAVGRGGADHDKIRAYIIHRAHQMGLQSTIPDNWNADGSLADAKSAMTEDEARILASMKRGAVVYAPHLTPSEAFLLRLARWQLKRHREPMADTDNPALRSALIREELRRSRV